MMPLRGPKEENPDEFAPIRNVLEMMASTFSSNFKAQQCTTVDEMFSLYCGRCPFKVFAKDKPGKHGILIRMLTDPHKRYVIAVESYEDKSSEASNKRKHIVCLLSQTIKGSSRYITMVRFYSSVELADELWHKSKLTMVDTMQSNRKHIPETMKIGKNR